MPWDELFSYMGEAERQPASLDTVGQRNGQDSVALMGNYRKESKLQ